VVISIFTPTAGQTNFDWMLNFYAPWCGHCKHVAPLYANAAKELKGIAKVGKIDAIANEALTRRFKVKGFPTFFMVSKGKIYAYPSAARDTFNFVKFAKVLCCE
jgi:protein disulfide-isomerase A6